jgi:hypothetical protein
MGKKESPLGELNYNDDSCKEIDKVKRKYSCSNMNCSSGNRT